MGLIADEQSAMAHVLKTAAEARTRVPPGRPGRNRPLKTQPAGSFSRRSARKTGKSTVWRPPVSFYPAGIRKGVEGPFPRETVALAPGGLMTVGPCDSGTAGAIVELSLFLEGPDHGQPHMQDLRPQRRRRRLLQLVRRGNHGQCPQPPLPRPTQETSSRTTDTSTEARTHGRHHILSTAPVRVAPALALRGVTI